MRVFRDAHPPLRPAGVGEYSAENSLCKFTCSNTATNTLCGCIKGFPVFSRHGKRGYCLA
jgi:hypothetical protein